MTSIWDPRAADAWLRAFLQPSDWFAHTLAFGGLPPSCLCLLSGHVWVIGEGDAPEHPHVTILSSAGRMPVARGDVDALWLPPEGGQPAFADLKPGTLICARADWLHAPALHSGGLRRRMPEGPDLLIGRVSLAVDVVSAR